MWTRDFDKISKDDVGIAGGKGASLGEMTQAGIRVPGGFVVLVSAFDKFLDDCGIRAEIESVLSGVKIEDINSINSASEKIVSLILDSSIEKGISNEILNEFKKLNCGEVAVRSSATAEDSSDAAWAGQLDSFLNTEGKDLLENVKKCWASLFTPRAIFYRFEKRLHNVSVGVAVVIQKMVQSEVSGIAFSVHPVTEDDDQIIIEAGLGLGEAIVSGSITPDSYVISKGGLEIIEVSINEQGRKLIRGNRGNVWVGLGSEGKKKFLNDEEIRELGKLIGKIENHYGFAVDVEWAKVGDNFYITQSRPITTLGKLEEKNRTVAEGVAGYSKPYLFLDKKILDRETKLIRNKKFDMFIRRRVPYFMDLYRLSSYELKNRWGLDITFFEAGHKQVKSVWMDSQLNESAADLWKNMAEDDSGFLDSIIDELKSIGKMSRDLAVDISEIKIKDTENNELADIVDRHVEYWIKYFSIAYLWFAIDPLVISLRKNIERAWVGSKDDLKHFLSIAFMPSSFPSSSREQRELLELKKLSPEDIDFTLKKHCEKYSFLSMRDIDDEPFSLDYFKDRLSIFNQEEEYKKTKESFSRADEDIVESADLIRNSDLPEDIRKWILFCRDVIYLRTEVIEDLSKVNLAYKAVFEEIANRLGLNIAELLHMLASDITESLRSGKLVLDKEKILDRVENGYAYLISPGASFFVAGNEVDKLRDAVIVEDKESEDIDLIMGTVAFKGIARGRVKVILDKSEVGILKQGEVLVTSMTTPDFVPDMRRSAAIITNEGGVLCHAAIMSRELGVPCIIGVKNATSILKDGDEVEVDGHEGVVRILKKN